MGIIGSLAAEAGLAPVKTIDAARQWPKDSIRSCIHELSPIACEATNTAAQVGSLGPGLVRIDR
jgi:hypothetical protein